MNQSKTIDEQKRLRELMQASLAELRKRAQQLALGSCRDCQDVASELLTAVRDLERAVAAAPVLREIWLSGVRNLRQLLHQVASLHPIHSSTQPRQDA